MPLACATQYTGVDELPKCQSRNQEDSREDQGNYE